jgi:hypothetical protein
MAGSSSRRNLQRQRSSMISRHQSSISVLGIIFGLFTAATLSAGTIPAGTALVVKTMASIYTKDMVGKQFSAELDQDLIIKGKTVAPAGTKLIGKIVTSTRFGNSPLSVDLTGIMARGKLIPLRTIRPFEPQSVQRGRRTQVSTRDFVLPPGAKMQFQLAEAVTI